MSAFHDDTLPALLANAVGRRPHGIALMCGRSRRTFLELQCRAQSFATGLAELGVGAGDCVAVWLPNVPLWYEALYACAQLGAVVIGINTRFRSTELADVLGRSGARVLICWPGFERVDFVDILESIDGASLDALKTIVAHDEDGPTVERIAGKPVIGTKRLFDRPQRLTSAAEADRGCILFTTSGTTARPKFVMHTQRSIVQHARDTVRGFGYDAAGTTLMAVTPFSGVAGFGLPIGGLAAVAPLVCAPVFDAAESLADIREHRVTHTHANHEIVRRWLEAARGPDDFATLQLVNCGSGIASVMPRAKELGMPLLSIYGSSELQARFSRQRSDIAPERAREAGGFPLSQDAHVRTSDPETGRLLPVGEKGELEVRAPSAMSGYFGDAAASACAITVDGYLRTGDFGWTRTDGSFVLEGRMGDVLKLSGFMTSPAEIEAQIAQHPAVSACQVVGVVTERGQRPVAFVRLAQDEGFDEQMLISYCAQRMARYKVPLRVFVLNEFPMTHGANAPKVRKAELAALAAARIRSAPGEER